MITSAQAQQLLRQQHAKTGRPLPAPLDLRPLNATDAKGTVEFTIPIRTWNPLNERPMYWVTAKKSKAQKAATAMALCGRALPPLPATVMLTRIGKQVMDSDAVPASVKHVRDQIAKAYGVGDGPKDPIVWIYPPSEVGKEYGVRVRLETRPVAPPPG